MTRKPDKCSCTGRRGGVLADLIFPCGTLYLDVDYGFGVMLRRVAREVDRFIFLRHLHLDVGLDLGQLIERAFVTGIGLVPDHGANRIGVVIDGPVSYT